MYKRFPSFADILPVFAVISTMYYTWSLVIFLYNLTGWLFYLHLGEIWGILAYEFITNFVESLVFLFLLLIACAILPARFLKDDFSVRGTVFSVVTIGSMMLFLNRYVATPAIRSSLGIWMLATLVLAVAATAVSSRVRLVRLAAAWISDRVIVFLFLFIPFSIISLLYVGARFLFS
jgi:hypothetical protein